MRRPRLIAHRGARLERPENTLPAFLRALELGADGIELDVHATRDGAVVVHHDAGVRSSAGEVEGPIARLALAELRRADVGGAAIPTLAEVLDVVGDRADVFIEIKAFAIERAVLDTIGRSPAPHRCAVHSFDHRTVKRARSADTRVPGGILLAGSFLVDPAQALRAADARDYWAEWRVIDEQVVGAVHAAGARVIAWSPSDRRDILALAQLGVDALCVDDVSGAREGLEQMR